MSYLKEHINYEPRQNERLDEHQVKNPAGGYVYQLGVMEYAKRFLIMGTEGGTYYESERDLTKESLDNLKQAIKEYGPAVIEMAVDISKSGRAAKNDQAIFALALGMTIGDEYTKKAVEDAFNAVVRTGSHLLMAVSFIDELRGWGRVPRRIVGNWYSSKTPEQLAYQVVKYRNRNGWTHRDVMMRVRHGKNSPLYRWMVGASVATGRTVKRRVGGVTDYDSPDWANMPKLVDAFDTVQQFGNLADSKGTDIIPLIEERNLTHEMIPTKFLKEPKVWEALLEKMPLGALLRNLGRMTALDMFPQMSGLAQEVCDKFTPDRVRKARLHPLNVINAIKTYENGQGMRGSLEWTPNSWIMRRLGEVFYWSFENIEPVNKPILLALDVSGSMFGGYGMPNSLLTCGEIAAVMAMVSARVEQYHHICAFDHQFIELPITSDMSLSDAMRVVRGFGWGATDCALPMLEADKRGWHNVEGFVVYTDNETWYGSVHPKRALEIYRDKTGLDSRLAVSAMTGTRRSIADGSVPYMMDFVGFSTNTPRVISQYLARGI